MAEGAAPFIYASAALEPGILGHQGSGLGIHMAYRVSETRVGMGHGGRTQAALAALHLAEGAEAPALGIGTGAEEGSSRLIVAMGLCFEDGDW